MFELAEKKMNLIRELRETTGELRVLLQRLGTFLPSVAGKDFHKRSAPTHHASPPVLRNHPAKTKIDFIESELDKIEAQLKGL